MDRELFDAAQALLAENDLETRMPGEARRGVVRARSEVLSGER